MAPGRTDRAERLIRATPEQVWRTWFDPEALARWLPPPDMRGEVLALEARPGGAFRLRLTYLSPEGVRGKTGADHDDSEGSFLSLDPPRGFVLALRFLSQDPQFAGTMRMEWSFAPEGGATRVGVICRDVPPGIPAEAHAEGLGASLAQLAAAVE